MADPVPQILDGVQHVPRERVHNLDVPVPQIMEEIVEIVAGEVVCNCRTGTGGRAHVEQIVDVPVPRILEQHGVLPHSPPPREGLILSACDGIWNMLFTTYSHASRWVSFRFSGCLSPVVAHVLPTHHSPIRVLRTSLMPSQPGFVSASPLGSTHTAVCCASSASNSSPADVGRGSFCAACSNHGRYARHRPSETDIARTQTLAPSTCALASESHRIACGTWTRQLCAWFQKSRVSPCLRYARPFVTVTLAANMRGGMWTQIVYEEKTDRVHSHGPLFPRQLVSHSPTHWITQDAP